MAANAKTTLLGLIASAAVVASTSVAAAGAETRNSARTAGTGIAAVRSAFSLLRLGHAAPPPRAVITGLGPTKEYGIHWSDAVMAKLAGGPTLWLIPGSHDSCLAWLDRPQNIYALATYDGTCATNSSVLKVGIYVVPSGASARETVVGVEPGNAKSLTASTSAGRRITVDLSRGVFTLTATKPAFVASFDTPGGIERLYKPLQW